MWVRAQQSSNSASGRLLGAIARFDFDAITTLTVQIVQVVQAQSSKRTPHIKQAKFEIGSSICEIEYPQQADGVSDI